MLKDTLGILHIVVTEPYLQTCSNLSLTFTLTGHVQAIPEVQPFQ